MLDKDAGHGGNCWPEREAVIEWFDSELPGTKLSNSFIVGLAGKVSKYRRELQDELTALREEVEKLRDYKADVENATKHAMSLHPDEEHCTCVPLLVKRVGELEERLGRIKEIADDLPQLPTVQGVDIGEFDEALDRICELAKGE